MPLLTCISDQPKLVVFVRRRFFDLCLVGQFIDFVLFILVRCLVIVCIEDLRLVCGDFLVSSSRPATREDRPHAWASLDRRRARHRRWLLRPAFRADRRRTAQVVEAGRAVDADTFGADRRRPYGSRIVTQPRSAVPEQAPDALVVRTSGAMITARRVLCARRYIGRSKRLRRTSRKDAPSCPRPSRQPSAQPSCACVPLSRRP